MAKIEMINQVEQAVEHSGVIKSPLRPYLGYSSIGHHCPRYLWYTFRWVYTKEITQRLQRLFNRGHQEEPIVIADLERAGMKCSNVVRHGMTEEEANTAQVTCMGSYGHIMGHPDGDVTNVPGAEQTEHNLEIKTANDKKFKEFCKFGVQRSNPQYYAQINAYMHHKGQTRTLFIITNKNTDDRYFERIPYDKDNYLENEERGIDVITSSVPLPKISTKPEWHECRFCDAKDICHFNAPYEKNCRTCQHIRLEEDGQWSCFIYKKDIPVDFQRKGCPDNYLPLER